MTENIHVVFGALGDPLNKQIPGLKNPELMQKLADAITILKAHSILTDCDSHKARTRLIKAFRVGQ